MKFGLTDSGHGDLGAETRRASKVEDVAAEHDDFETRKISANQSSCGNE